MGLLHTDPAQLRVSLGRASRQVEALVFLPARFFAVADALATALNFEQLALIAKFALADLYTVSVFVLVGKLFSFHFHKDHLRREVVVCQSDRRAHVRFE